MTKINWFPGHMNRARREIGDAIRKCDVVVELVDARLPRSSRNPMLGELAREKPILTLFTKSDLADPEVTEAWIEAWEGPRPLALVMSERKSVAKILDGLQANPKMRTIWFMSHVIRRFLRPGRALASAGLRARGIESFPR